MGNIYNSRHDIRKRKLVVELRCLRTSAPLALELSDQGYLALAPREVYRQRVPVALDAPGLAIC